METPLDPTPQLVWKSVLNNQNTKNYFKELKSSDQGDLAIVSSDKQVYLATAAQLFKNLSKTQEFSTICNPEPVYQVSWIPKQQPSILYIAGKSQPISSYEVLKSDSHVITSTKRRDTFRVMDAFNEFSQAYSFGLTCYFLVAGSCKHLHVFDLQRPGQQLVTYSLSRRHTPGLQGIISSVSPQHFGNGFIYAVGSISGISATVDIREPHGVTTRLVTASIKKTSSAVTQIAWTKQHPHRVLVGLRQHNFLYVWDDRYSKNPYFVLPRTCSNTQRCPFDTFITISSQSESLLSGTSQGECLWYSLQTGQLVHHWKLHPVTLTGLALFPYLNSLYLATCSGTRLFSTFGAVGSPDLHFSSESASSIKVHKCQWPRIVV